MQALWLKPACSASADSKRNASIVNRTLVAFLSFLITAIIPHIFMARAYYASRISANLYKTPEQTLVAPGVTIARTGWQKYGLRELPQDRAQELGLDISDWNKSVDVYRDPSEVFSPATIASFEGKPVVSPHPPDFVNPENWGEYALGHVQFVRRGTEALESGDWPLLADLIISDASLIKSIENGGPRSLSCGYSYDLDREGDRLVQKNIIGNHTAVISEGRAGPEARINDAAPEVTQQVQQSEAGKRPEVPQIKTKENHTVKNRFLDVIGRGLKALGADESVSPEDYAAAAIEVAAGRGRAKDETEEELEKKREEDKKKADDKAAEDRKKADDMKAAADKKTAEDKKRADDEAEEERKKKEAEDAEMFRTAKSVGDHRCKDCMGADAKCHDCKMHDALDDMLTKKKEEEGDDADINELKELVATHGMEPVGDEMEPDGSEVIEPVGEDSHVPANDSVALLEPAISKTKDANVKKAYDAASVHLEDEHAFLMTLRPAIARSADKEVRRAFDAAIKKFRPSYATGASYGHVAKAAGLARDARPVQNYQKLDEFYANQLKGGKK